LITTPQPPRIADLSEISSPILSGSIPLVDVHGEFRYDVALMETNRGCPYNCAFCYWGGATGQKVRTFPRERLQQETYYVRREQKFDYDIPTLVSAIKQQLDYSLEKKPITIDIWYQAGFANYIGNNEGADMFFGQPRYCPKVPA
jgi:hypothetical protein